MSPRRCRQPRPGARFPRVSGDEPLVGPFRIVKESQNGKSFWTTVDLGEGEPAWKPVNDYADALCEKMSATPDAPSFSDEPLMPDFGA